MMHLTEPVQWRRWNAWPIEIEDFVGEVATQVTIVLLWRAGIGRLGITLSAKWKTLLYRRHCSVLALMDKWKNDNVWLVGRECYYHNHSRLFVSLHLWGRCLQSNIETVNCNVMTYWVGRLHGSGNGNIVYFDHSILFVNLYLNFVCGRFRVYFWHLCSFFSPFRYKCT